MSATELAPEVVDGSASPKPYTVSEQFTHLASSPEEFRSVIAERMCRLQNTLANLNPTDRRQAICDIVYLKAVLDGKGEEEAQGLADQAWMANI